MFDLHIYVQMCYALLFACYPFVFSVPRLILFDLILDIKYKTSLRLLPRKYSDENLIITF